MDDRPQGGRPATPPLVSVSLVAWNGARWLPGFLESVRAQEHVRVELLAVDNGSHDGSAEVLVHALDDGMPGRLLRKGDNEGYAAAHNRNQPDAR